MNEEIKKEQKNVQLVQDDPKKPPLKILFYNINGFPS